MIACLLIYSPITYFFPNSHLPYTLNWPIIIIYCHPIIIIIWNTKCCRIIDQLLTMHAICIFHAISHLQAISYYYRTLWA